MMPDFVGKRNGKGSNRKAKAIKKIKRRMRKAERLAFKAGLPPRNAKLKGRKNSGEYVFTHKGKILFD
jgi:hypothetical protein